MDLTDAQIARLTKTSAVAPEVIRARGYRNASLNDADYYKSLGWTNLAKALPGLEIPLWGMNGKSTKVQLRPDAPPVLRDADGKTRTQKYLFPAGEVAQLDVNPLIVEKLKGLEPLFVTEGIIKGDSAVSHGLVCIALLGVWNFRGQNGHGGSTVLPDWDEISLQGRDVYIVFDSDVTTKRTVQAALNRLVAFLSNRGARVTAIILPEAPNGDKMGLDDWFAAGHSVPGLMECARKEFFTEEDSGTPYSEQAPVTYGCDSVMWRQITKSNEVIGERQNLTTFAAQVDQRITLDDGVADPTVTFRVSGRTEAGMPLPSTEVVALSDIITSLVDGDNPIWSQPGVTVNNGVKSIDKEVANCLRVDMERRGVEEIAKYTHTGWREVNGQFVYLTAAGGIGASGLDGTILVDLAGPQLEIDISEIGTAQDVRRSLEIINAGDERILSTLLCGAYAAPLREVVDIGFSIHMFGHTGTYKTELARIIASHFGRRVAQRVGLGMGSWMSTQNALTMMASAAKDALYVIDDLVPKQMNKYDLQGKTDVVFRSTGNAAGRSRMGRDTTMRTTYIPRCMVLSTGEDLPPGESVLARLVLVEIDRDSIASPALSTLQALAQEGVYERAMGAYIQWLAAHFSELKSLVAAIEHDADFTTIGTGHARLLYNNKALLTGIGMYLLFARTTNALTPEEARNYMVKFRNGLIANAEITTHEVKSSTPAAKVSEIISSVVSRGEGHFVSKASDTYTPGLEYLGWSYRGDNYVGLGPALGYYDKERDALLMQGDVLAAELKKGGLAISKRQLMKELADSKYLLTDYSPEGGHTHVVRLRSGVRMRLLALDLNKLMPDLQFAAQVASEEAPKF